MKSSIGLLTILSLCLAVSSVFSEEETGAKRKVSSEPPVFYGCVFERKGSGAAAKKDFTKEFYIPAPEADSSVNYDINKRVIKIKFTLTGKGSAKVQLEEWENSVKLADEKSIKDYNPRNPPAFEMPMSYKGKNDLVIDYVLKCE